MAGPGTQKPLNKSAKPSSECEAGTYVCVLLCVRAEGRAHGRGLSVQYMPLCQYANDALAIARKTFLNSTPLKKNLRNSMGSIGLYKDFESHFVIIYKSFLRISHFL